MLAEVANKVDPDVEDRNDSDGPNNDDCEDEKAIRDPGPIISSTFSKKNANKGRTIPDPHKLVLPLTSTISKDLFPFRTSW